MSHETTAIEKLARDAGWTECRINECPIDAEVIIIGRGTSGKIIDEPLYSTVSVKRPKGNISRFPGSTPVLCSPRSEPEYESGTVALIQAHRGSRGAEVAMRIEEGSWDVPYGLYAASEVEVLRVIAYPDGTTPEESITLNAIRETGRTAVDQYGDTWYWDKDKEQFTVNGAVQTGLAFGLPLRATAPGYFTHWADKKGAEE